MKPTKKNQLIESVSHICEVGVNYSIKLKRGDRTRIIKSKLAESILRPWYDKTGLMEQKEIFTALLLTRSNDFIGLIKVSEGDANACIVDIKFLLRAAILCNASAIILCHNHPSGNLVASDADKNITEKLKGAARLVDMQVLDHVILAPDSGYLSFLDDGLI